MAIITNVESARALNNFPGVQRRAVLTMFGDPLEGNGLTNGLTLACAPVTPAPSMPAR